MSLLARYSTEQRAVLLNSAAAVAVCVAVLAAGYAWLPPKTFALVPAMEAGERIAFALKVDVLVFLWLAGCLRAVSAGRFHSAADIRGSAYAPPSPAIAVRAAVLQNSLEQTVLAVGAHLALAAVLRGDELVLIPLVVLLYLAGRVSFAARYAQGAGRRAFGMALTGVSTIAAYIIAIAMMLAR
jgi:hypothetical protein